MLLPISSVKFMSKKLWSQNWYITAWALRSSGQSSAVEFPRWISSSQTHSSLEAKTIEIISPSPPLPSLKLSNSNAGLLYNLHLATLALLELYFPSFSLIHGFNPICHCLDLNCFPKDPWLMAWFPW